MANAKNYSGGSYMKPADLDGPISVKVIKCFESQDFNNNDCLVLDLDNDKKLQLNATNVKAMIDLHGEETDDWSGKEIGLNPGTYSFKKDGEEKTGPTILIVATDDLPF